MQPRGMDGRRRQRGSTALLREARLLRPPVKDFLPGRRPRHSGRARRVASRPDARTWALSGRGRGSDDFERPDASTSAADPRTGPPAAVGGDMRKLIVSSLVSLDGIHSDPQSWIGDYFDQQAVEESLAVLLDSDA